MRMCEHSTSARLLASLLCSIEANSSLQLLHEIDVSLEPIYRVRLEGNPFFRFIDLSIFSFYIAYFSTNSYLLLLYVYVVLKTTFHALFMKQKCQLQMGLEQYQNVSTPLPTRRINTKHHHLR